MKTFQWVVRRVVSAVALCVALGVPAAQTSCTPGLAAAVLPIVKDVIIEIVDAEQKLDLVDGAAAAWFKKYPDARLASEYQNASDRVRASLNVALQMAHGTRDLAEGDIDAAFHQFGLAWMKLWEMAQQIGFVTEGGTLQAGPVVGLSLEPPLALSRTQSP